MGIQFNATWKFWKWGLLAVLCICGIVVIFNMECRSPYGCDALSLDRTAGLAAVGQTATAPAPPAAPMMVTKFVTSAAQIAAVDNGPMVIQSIALRFTARDLSGFRVRINDVVRRFQGYIDRLSIQDDTPDSSSLSATLRMPADRLQPALSELRTFGSLKEESETSQDVTSGYTDLVARLSNSRRTEQRLLNLLNDRTGKLADVVLVEKEIGEVRERIEQLEVQQRGIQNQVRYASIQIQITAETAIVSSPVPARLLNAFTAGYRNAANEILQLTLNALQYGPIIIIYLLPLSAIALAFRRRARHSSAES